LGTPTRIARLLSFCSREPLDRLLLPGLPVK
jgi:hypothetical protein